MSSGLRRMDGAGWGDVWGDAEEGPEPFSTHQAGAGSWILDSASVAQIQG